MLVIYVAVNLMSQCVTPGIEPVDFECLFVNIIFHENKHLTMGTIYGQTSLSLLDLDKSH